MTENSQESISDDEQLRRFLLSLIREHCDPSSEDGFVLVCRQVADYFDELGEYQLSSFVRAQIGDEPYWVPQ